MLDEPAGRQLHGLSASFKPIFALKKQGLTFSSSPGEYAFEYVPV